MWPSVCGRFCVLESTCPLNIGACPRKRRNGRSFTKISYSLCSAFVPHTNAMSDNITTPHDTSESSSEQRKRVFPQVARLARSSLTTQGPQVRTLHRPRTRARGTSVRLARRREPGRSNRGSPIAGAPVVIAGKPPRPRKRSHRPLPCPQGA